MSFLKYSITNKLLFNIREITKVSCDLNNKRFSNEIYSDVLQKTKQIGFAELSLDEEQGKKYVKVLEKYSKKNIDFNINIILSIHSDLMEGFESKNQVGKFKNNSAKKSVKNLVKFLNSISNETDSLIVGGLFYKNFLAISPFVHSNEQVAILTTRILLRDLDINVFNLLSFEKIGKVSINDNSKWLEYFTEIVFNEMFRIKKELEKTSFRPESELNEDQKKVLKYLKKYGVITDSEYSKITQRKKATRVLDFNKLIEKNLIERRGRGKLTHYILK